MDQYSKVGLAFVKDRSDWYGQGACTGTDPDLFFPEKGANRSAIEPARAVCAGCAVRDLCLEYALAVPREKFGIWAGTTEQERRAILRQRAVARRAAAA